MAGPRRLGVPVHMPHQLATNFLVSILAWLVPRLLIDCSEGAEQPFPLVTGSPGTAGNGRTDRVGAGAARRQYSREPHGHTSTASRGVGRQNVRRVSPTVGRGGYAGSRWLGVRLARAGELGTLTGRGLVSSPLPRVGGADFASSEHLSPAFRRMSTDAPAVSRLVGNAGCGASNDVDQDQNRPKF